MPEERRRQGPSPTERTTPVRPGTPLYRLLEMVAQAIARDLEGAPPGPSATPETPTGRAKTRSKN